MNYLKLLPDSLLILVSKYISVNSDEGCLKYDNIVEICETCAYSNKCIRRILASFCIFPQQILFMDCHIAIEFYPFSESVNLNIYNEMYYCEKQSMYQISTKFNVVYYFDNRYNTNKFMITKEYDKIEI